jgi:hypothetical protein
MRLDRKGRRIADAQMKARQCLKPGLTINAKKAWLEEICQQVVLDQDQRHINVLNRIDPAWIAGAFVDALAQHAALGNGRPATEAMVFLATLSERLKNVKQKREFINFIARLEASYITFDLFAKIREYATFRNAFQKEAQVRAAESAYLEDNAGKPPHERTATSPKCRKALALFPDFAHEGFRSGETRLENEPGWNEYDHDLYAAKAVRDAFHVSSLNRLYKPTKGKEDKRPCDD